MLSRKGERERTDTEDSRLSSVIFLVLRSPRLGEHCDEDIDGVEPICPPSDISSEPVLRDVFDVSIRADVGMTLSGPALSGEEREGGTRESGEWTQRAGSPLRWRFESLFRPRLSKLRLHSGSGATFGEEEVGSGGYTTQERGVSMLAISRCHG